MENGEIDSLYLDWPSIEWHDTDWWADSSKNIAFQSGLMVVNNKRPTFVVNGRSLYFSHAWWIKKSNSRNQCINPNRIITNSACFLKVFKEFLNSHSLCMTLQPLSAALNDLGIVHSCFLHGSDSIVIWPSLQRTGRTLSPKWILTLSCHDKTMVSSVKGKN